MNNYLYPKTYKDRANYIFKEEKKKLIVLTFLFCLFALPFFGYIIFSKFFFEEVMKIKTDSITHVLLSNAPALIISFIFGLGLSGCLYCYRRLLQSDTVVIKYHFFKGIKNSGFETGLFISIVYLIYIIFELFRFSILRSGTPLYFLYAIFEGVLILFALFIATITIISSSMYVVSIPRAIKDGLLSLKHFKVLFPRFLLLLIPYICCFTYAFNYAIYLNIFGACLYLIFSSYFLIYKEIYTLELFDKEININSYKDYYKRGLYED